MIPCNPDRGGAGGRRIYGVVVGIVSNNTDPEQIGRVKITYPWMGGSVESNWARVLDQYRRLNWTEDDTIAAVEQRIDSPSGARATRDDYRYDDAGRLVGWSKDSGPQRSYELDPADNLVREPGGPDRTYAADRLVGDAEGAVYRYDTDGRLAAITHPGARDGTGKGTTRLWFDARSRLTRVHTADDRVVHHRYDALGRRIETTAESSDGGLHLEELAYDGDRLARRIIRDPATRDVIRDETYTYDPEFERPLFRLVRGVQSDDMGEVQYYTTDQRGAVVRLTAADGTALWVGHADPYGRYREEGPEAGQQPLRLAGQVHDAATGLCHHRFRVYDPQDARFITPDPIGLLGGDNAFGYPSDPIVFADPLGLASCPVVEESSRRRAMDRAQEHAGVRRTSRGGENIMGSELNTESRGQNFNRLGGQNAVLGRRDSSGAEVFDHPDGHPHQVGPGHPDHHASPHVHATNSQGDKLIVTYPSGT